MTGVKRDGINNAPKVSLGSKLVRMVDGRLIGMDGLPVQFNCDDDGHDSSSSDDV